MSLCETKGVENDDTQDDVHMVSVYGSGSRYGVLQPSAVSRENRL
jgi:hypothetical protein